MKVTFETDEGKKYEVTPQQMRLTQTSPRTAALQIPVGDDFVDVTTFACKLTLDGLWG